MLPVSASRWTLVIVCSVSLPPRRRFGIPAVLRRRRRDAGRVRPRQEGSGGSPTGQSERAADASIAAPRDPSLRTRARQVDLGTHRTHRGPTIVSWSWTSETIRHATRALARRAPRRARRAWPLPRLAWTVRTGSPADRTRAARRRPSRRLGCSPAMTASALRVVRARDYTRPLLGRCARTSSTGCTRGRRTRYPRPRCRSRRTPHRSSSQVDGDHDAPADPARLRDARGVDPRPAPQTRPPGSSRTSPSSSPMSAIPRTGVRALRRRPVARFATLSRTGALA